MSNLLWMAAGGLVAALAVAGQALLPAALDDDGSPSALQAAAAAASDPALLTRVGDEVGLHVALFDAHGRMLVSTRAGDRAELEETKAAFPGLYVLPLTEADAPQRHVVTNGTRPAPYEPGTVVPLGQELVGKPAGHVAAFPVVGRVPGYDNVTTLERLRGPFNRTLTLSTATLANLTDGSEADRVALDDLFEADVIERGPVASRIRLDVRDGQVLTVRQAGFDAVVVLDEAEDRFFLRLDATEGHEFALQASCAFARYVLPPGSYRVTGVTDDAITVASSPVKWPQIIGRDLIMVLEIIDIRRTEVN